MQRKDGIDASYSEGIPKMLDAQMDKEIEPLYQTTKMTNISVYRDPKLIL